MIHVHAHDAEAIDHDSCEFGVIVPRDEYLALHADQLRDAIDCADHIVIRDVSSHRYALIPVGADDDGESLARRYTFTDDDGKEVPFTFNLDTLE